MNTVKQVAITAAISVVTLVLIKKFAPDSIKDAVRI